MSLDEEETFEERVKRYARNRYEMRVQRKWRIHETAEDDWRYATDLANREYYGSGAIARPQENISGSKPPVSGS